MGKAGMPMGLSSVFVFFFFLTVLLHMQLASRNKLKFRAFELKDGKLITQA